MPVQLQYVLLMADKTNKADLSSDVFIILISVTRMIKIQKLLMFHKFRQKLANSDITTLGNTELYCLFITADSIVDDISFIRCIAL